ncbi:GIY-YIG nuclease family protein [Streptomyces rubiginosohelvolus]|uniref:GIY-YIG nuclease family protein n=1 Tax=Streptomyces rubiginosohelvolus TaxID=67362 RepID=UPI0035D59D38
MTNQVYLIGSTDSSLVKIGWTDNPKRRLRDLQTGSPVLLQLLAVFEGGPIVEAELHRQFADQRRHGEWFDLGPDPVAVVSPFVKAAQVEEDERTGRRQPVHDVATSGPLTAEVIAWFPDDPPSAYERVEQECPTWKAAGRCLCDS